MKRILLAATLALGAIAANTALADTASGTVTIGGEKVRVDGNGMTLYTFDKDSQGVSNCTGGCAEKWPPLMAASGARAQGDFGLISRPGAGAYGGKQWTYGGMPLYTWVGDSKVGDTNGDGVKGVWHTAHYTK